MFWPSKRHISFFLLNSAFIIWTEGAVWKIAVLTDSSYYAASPSPINVTLYGTEGSHSARLKEHFLLHISELFVTYLPISTEIGEVTSVKLWENDGLDGWISKTVAVKNLATGKQWTFTRSPCTLKGSAGSRVCHYTGTPSVTQMEKGADVCKFTEQPGKYFSILELDHTVSEVNQTLSTLVSYNRCAATAENENFEGFVYAPEDDDTGQCSLFNMTGFVRPKPEMRQGSQIYVVNSICQNDRLY